MSVSRCVIDVGNTSIASGLFLDGEIVSPRRIGTSHVSILKDVEELVGDVTTRTAEDFTEIVVCLGVAKIRTIFELYARSSKVKVHFVTGTNLCGAKISYETPESLGPDRVANTIAVNQLHELPSLVIDCGTAITIDVVDADGVFQGGMITPGLNTSRNSLTIAAPSLPDVPLEIPSNPIGKNTVESIQSGVLYGAAHMIDETIDRFSKAYEIKSILLTGGDSSKIVSVLRPRFIHDEWLTLRGLGFAQLD